ncbi:lactonase family protein [Haloferax sp. YSSS75]|uniref:lactonase family protein n=1 Tax=Haloferax sp. YSSS75 TaxID=3388564 RepID=UPI00398CB4B4
MHRAVLSTYSPPDQVGLYSLTMAQESGALKPKTGINAGRDPSYLAINSKTNHVYVVNEDSTGCVRAYNLNTKSGALELINVISTPYPDPCYCSVLPEYNVVLVSHYVGAAVSVLPIGPSGRLLEPSCMIEHSGSSVNPDRQRQAHPHAIVPGPNHRYVYVPDLGTDQIVIYQFEQETRSLLHQTTVDVSTGAGPRHLDFHPSGDYAYLINELHSTLTVFEWNERTGELFPIQTIETAPKTVENTAADIHVHPSGDFVYASNRGHDSIAVYQCKDDGSLHAVENEPTRGRCPRNFAISPDGQYLYAENQLSNTVVVFNIDSGTGRLTSTGRKLTVPNPVCLKFV